MTKAAFEQLFNRTYGFSDVRQGSQNQLGAKTRPYGTWMRSADREQFNYLYLEFLETGKIWGDEDREIVQ